MDENGTRVTYITKDGIEYGYIGEGLYIPVYDRAYAFLQSMNGILNEQPLLREFLEKLSDKEYAVNNHLEEEYDLRVMLNQSLRLSNKNMKLSSFIYGLLVNEETV